VILTISGGEVYAPAPLGPASMVVLNGTVAAIGDLDLPRGEMFGLPIDTLDASDASVVPGLIDPHVHLIGGSGEQGYSTWTPEIFLTELITAGVTTVVGCLGVDTTMKNMATLVGKAKGLCGEGITAYVYSGGYNVPPATVLGSVRRDMIFINEVIGAGEIAISDRRGSQRTPGELAQVVADAYVGGLLTGKAGVTHFHVGDGRDRMAPLRQLLEAYEVSPASLYASHVERTRELLLEAAAISRHGVFVDIDTVEGDLTESLDTFSRAGGDLQQLTVSSDASITSPRRRLDQFRQCARTADWPLDRLLPLITLNPATALKLPRKGRLEVGADADILVLQRDTLELRHVVAGGRVLMRDGKVVVRERFLHHSSRRVTFNGNEAQAADNI
jgi:beta-aspartyl-dipeptidase (metallo-type)